MVIRHWQQNLNIQEKQISNEEKTYTQQTVQQATNSSLALFILSTYQGMARDPNFRVNGFTDTEVVALLTDVLNKFPERTDIAGIRNSVEAINSKNIMGRKTRRQKFLCLILKAELLS